jgi:predicted RNA-binding Zn ribbon-like protein
MEDGQVRDLLGDEGGVRCWLDLHGFSDEDAVLCGGPLVEARQAILDALETGGAAGDGSVHGGLNQVLARGAYVPWVADDGTVVWRTQVAPSWGPAWLAAADFLALLARYPGRVRQCEGPACILYFLDASRNRSRRWHSMEGCGNRQKASRHYARARGGAAEPARRS